MEQLNSITFILLNNGRVLKVKESVTKEQFDAKGIMRFTFIFYVVHRGAIVGVYEDTETIEINLADVVRIKNAQLR